MWEFIGWGSRADAKSLTGRATQAYPVYKKASSQILFLKDSWRAKCLEKKADILKTLNDAHIQNVPNLVCSGDIKGHQMLTNNYASDDAQSSWKCGCDSSKIVERIHHRFVGNFVGCHLSEFTSTKEMMQVIRDAYIGASFMVPPSQYS
jgi:fructosamine-3-kinase